MPAFCQKIYHISNSLTSNSSGKIVIKLRRLIDISTLSFLLNNPATTYFTVFKKWFISGPPKHFKNKYYSVKIHLLLLNKMIKKKIFNKKTSLFISIRPCCYCVFCNQINNSFRNTIKQLVFKIKCTTPLLEKFYPIICCLNCIPYQLYWFFHDIFIQQ